MIIIVVILTFSALLILATVKLTNLKNAKNNPLYLANVNKTHGKFLCYKRPDGKLNSIFIHYSSDGTVLKEVNEDLQDCSFKIPNEINEYKVILVGGGAGGRSAVYDAQLPEMTAENSINITPYENIYLQDTMRYFGKDSIAMKDISSTAGVLNWLESDFFKNLVKSYSPYNGDGVSFSGGKCLANVDYLSETFSAKIMPKGKLYDYLNVVFKNSPVCNIVKNPSGEYVLAGSVLDDSGNFLPDAFNLHECVSREICSDDSPCCRYKNNLNSDSENALNEDDYSRTLTDNSFEYLYKTIDVNNAVSFLYAGNKDSILLYYLKSNFKIQEGAPGEPGGVVSCSVKELPADSSGNYIITNNMVGAGGKGGVEPTSGGITDVSLPDCASANGGAIGEIQNESTVRDTYNVSDIQPVAGKIPAENVPYADFELSSLYAGYYDSESNKLYNATLPGASGSSGGLKFVNSNMSSQCNDGFVLNSAGVQLFPSLSVANCLETKDESSGTVSIDATNGAGGAVIVAW